MIEITNLAGRQIFVNHEQIRIIEAGADTILCFVDGTRLPVRDKPQEIRDKIIQFKLKLQEITWK